MSEKKERDFEFEVFFDNLITKGRVEKEEEVTPGFKVKVRPLNTDEQITAETIALANNPYIPTDVIEKVRIVNILTRAIISVNGVEIGAQEGDSEEIKKRRAKLHDKIMKMPTSVVDAIYSLYVKVYEEQRKLYSPEDNLGEKIENF